MPTREIPASPAPVETIALHWSATRRGWGLRIGLLADGTYGVYNIAPVAGRPTAYLFASEPTEQGARATANREWKGMRLGRALPSAHRSAQPA